MTKGLLVHATSVAIDGRGVLLRGPSGAGKSDLALRLIDAGACLVSDDQSLLTRRGDALIATAPPAIAGLFEVRGFGIVRLEVLPEAPVALIADLAEAERIERMPARRFETVLGLAVPLIAVAPFETSAAAKVRLALNALSGFGLPAIMRE
jgi:HPr kinase/phosphorylase